MGWFDSQIKERLEHDEDLVSQAAWDLSVAITGRAAGGAEVDAGKAAADAVGEVLAYYRVKPADAPRDPKSVRDLIDAQLRGTGVMCRRVVLSKGWQRDAAGAMLGFVDGAPVALIPQPAGGFAYSDVATGEKVRVDRANAARLAQEAYCFYQPLPQRELGVRDVLLHMVRSLDLSDYVMIVAATLAVTLLGMLLPAVNSLIFGPVVDSGNVGVVVPIAVLLASVTCARVLIGGAKELVMSRVGTKLSLSVQAAAMMRTLSLPAPFYRAYASGDLSTRLSSIETLASMLQNIVLTTGLTSVFLSGVRGADSCVRTRFGLARAGRDPGQRGSVGGVRAGAGERDQAQAGALRAPQGMGIRLVHRHPEDQAGRCGASRVRHLGRFVQRRGQADVQRPAPHALLERRADGGLGGGHHRHLLHRRADRCVDIGVHGVQSGDTAWPRARSCRWPASPATSRPSSRTSIWPHPS